MTLPLVRKPVRWQRKNLGALITASITDISSGGGANADFKFTGLTIGNTYRLTLFMSAQITGIGVTENVQINAMHNGSELTRALFRIPNSTGTQALGTSSNVIFIATAASVTFDVAITGTITISASPATYIMLEELSDYEDTTDF